MKANRKTTQIKPKEWRSFEVASDLERLARVRPSSDPHHSQPRISGKCGITWFGNRFVPARGLAPVVQLPNPTCRHFFTCPDTSFVISNMLTLFLPLNTAFKASSALIWVRTFLSCSPFLRM